MATRRGRTIDPAKIVTIDNWAHNARRRVGKAESGYTNVVLGPHGELQVLDPSSGELAKTVPHEYGIDYLDALQSDSVELRASAEDAQVRNRDTIETNIRDALATFLDAERALLDATQAWPATSDPALKRQRTLEIGRLSKAVQDAEETLQYARYPHRYLAEDRNIPRKAIQYTTMDDRLVSITQLRQMSTTCEERVITV